VTEMSLASILDIHHCIIPHGVSLLGRADFGPLRPDGRRHSRTKFNLAGGLIETSAKNISGNGAAAGCRMAVGTVSASWGSGWLPEQASFPN
jgi:hypothetical protein